MKEMRRTAFGSVVLIYNISNHKLQAAIVTHHMLRLKPKPCSPNKVKLAGARPKIFSSENILAPIDSAIKALATKKAAMLIGRALVGPVVKYVSDH